MTGTVIALYLAFFVPQLIHQRTPEEFEADLLRDLRGRDEGLEIARTPAIPNAVGPQVVSAKTLRHRIPKGARRTYEHAGKLIRAGDDAGATKELERAIALDPQFGAAHNDLGVQYSGLMRYAEAEVEFQRATELLPESPVAHRNLAAIQLRLGKRAEAEQRLRRAIQLAPNDVTAHSLLDRLLSRRQ